MPPSSTTFINGSAASKPEFSHAVEMPDRVYSAGICPVSIKPRVDAMKKLTGRSVPLSRANIRCVRLFAGSPGRTRPTSRFMGVGKETLHLYSF